MYVSVHTLLLSHHGPRILSPHQIDSGTNNVGSQPAQRTGAGVQTPELGGATVSLENSRLPVRFCSIRNKTSRHWPQKTLSISVCVYEQGCENGFPQIIKLI